MRSLLPVLVLALTACGEPAEAPSSETPAPKATETTPPAPKPAEPPPAEWAKAPSDVAAAPADAKVTASGLAYKVLAAEGAGAHPTADATVKVHYTGWTTDGEMFDSSHKRGTPAAFPLKGVIAGWTEGVQLMKVGDSFRFWIPEELAYKGRPGAPAGMLVFDVQLLDVKEPAAAPPDVAAPPADATVTASGLAYKVITPGPDGGTHPTADSRVEVHYTGWTTDGKMFDSSHNRGQTATFPLRGVIAGWTEGVQLMTPGSTYRFWIPEALAYKGMPGKPAGMLVFDVDLISIK